MGPVVPRGARKAAAPGPMLVSKWTVRLRHGWKRLVGAEDGGGRGHEGMLVPPSSLTSKS